MDNEDEFDIVIIGAGLTGLSTAYHILKRKAGLSVLIIEGSNNIGGRLASEGCDFAYHANTAQPHIMELVERMAMSTCRREPMDDKNKILLADEDGVIDPPPYKAMEIHYFMRRIQESTSCDLYHAMSEDLATISIDECIRKLVCIPYARSVCRALIYATCGVRNLQKVSALWLLNVLSGAGGLLRRLNVSVGDSNRYFIKGGMMQLAEQLLNYILAEKGTIKFMESATRIQHNDERIYVHTGANCYRCNFVVIAVPPPDSAQIIIEPTLNENLEKCQKLYAREPSVFFIATYARNFWLSQGDYSGDILTTERANTNLYMTYEVATFPEEQAILAGFLETPVFLPTNKAQVFDTLALCFDNPEARNLLKVEEFPGRFQFTQARGSRTSDARKNSGPMNFLRPGPASYHVDMTNLLEDSICYASAEYATNWPGTMDGAIEAGEHCACSILMRIRPQVLTSRDLMAITLKKRRRRFISLPYKVAAAQYLLILVNIVIFVPLLWNAYL